MVEFASGVEGAAVCGDEGFAGDCPGVVGVVGAEGVYEEGVEPFDAVPWEQSLVVVADGVEGAGACGGEECVVHFGGCVEASVGAGDFGFEPGFVVVCPAWFHLFPGELLWVLDFELAGVAVPGDVVEAGVVGED